MMDALALLWPPFLVALCLVGIHTYFGIQVLARKVIFVDLALAQIAALGTTVAFMLGHSMQGWAAHLYSLVFTLAAAFLLAFTPIWSRRISPEALIGVIYVVAAAAAILLIDRAPQGAEHLKQILTGNILTVGTAELAAVVPLYVAIGALHRLLWARLTPTHGGTWLSEFLFYASFGVVVTSSVAMAGVLLVFSFLIMPAALGVLLAQTFGRQLAIGWIAGTLASALGLIASYLGDLPTGATMVCAFGFMLASGGLAYPFVHGDGRRMLTRVAFAGRWAVVVVLAASALLLMAAPRADHPVLDGLEYAAPAVRNLYFSRSEDGLYRDAAAYAARYAREAEKLNMLETRSRAEGDALDDGAVRRISAFIKSYAEMRRGEEFVQREVRARARERARWFFGPVLLALALVLVPGVPTRVRRALRRSS